MKSIQETRRERLRKLIREKYGGSTGAFAKAMGWEQPAFASRLVSKSPGNIKNIGSRLARAIEDAAKVPKNYLDTPEGELVTSLRLAGRVVQLELLESQLLSFFRALSRDAQEQLLGRAQSLYLTEHPEISKANPFASALEPGGTGAGKKPR